MRVVREVDQRAPYVDDHEPKLLRRVGGDQPAPEPAQQRGLAALAVAEHEEVRLGAAEADPHRVQPALLDAERDALARRRRRQLARVELARQQPDRRRRSAGPVLGRGAGQLTESGRDPLVLGAAVHARQRGLEVQAVHGQAAARDLGRQRRGRLARDQRVDRVVQLELEPRAQVVEQRRPDLGPAVGGHHDVDAEAEPGGGQLLDLAVEHLELALERLPAVDEQEEVGERARHRAAVIDSWPACRNACSRSSTSVRSWRTTRVTASRSSLPAMPPTCGAPASAPSRPPPRSIP